MGTYIGLTIYLPVYFETVRGLSASPSGLALIPLMVGTVAGATPPAASMSRFVALQAPAASPASLRIVWDRHPGVRCGCAADPAAVEIAAGA